jgi:hypothetical protein
MKKLTLVLLISLGVVSSASAATRPWAVQRDADLGFHFSNPTICLRGQAPGITRRAKRQESSSAGFWQTPAAMMKRPMYRAGDPGS